MNSILLLSGGLDSLVLLAKEHSRGHFPLCVSFGYGQRHLREMNAAARIADHYKVQRLRVDLPAQLFQGSALTGAKDIPLGRHYADPEQGVTVVPNRNLVFLSVAAALAVQHHKTSVLFAAHAGDASVYSDCRPDFVSAASIALKLACVVSVEAPFLGLTKRDIVRLGRSLDAPLDLAWSCYVGGEAPCGRCGACVEREEAMA